MGPECTSFVPVDQLAPRGHHRTRPASKAASSCVRVSLGNHGIPAGPREEREAAADPHEIDRPVLAAGQEGGDVSWIPRQPQQVRGGVSESGRDIAEHRVMRSRHVEADSERPVTTRHHNRPVRLDARLHPLAELRLVAGGDGMDVGSQRALGKLDRAARAARPRATRRLVDKDSGGAKAH